MATHPLAAQSAPAGTLVDPHKLLTAYSAETPDPAIREQRVTFGTSGHRGSSLSGAAIGGLTLVTEQGCFAVRPSGTEDVYKVYAERFREKEHLRRIQGEARTLVTQALARGEITRPTFPALAAQAARIYRGPIGR